MSCLSVKTFTPRRRSIGTGFSLPGAGTLWLSESFWKTCNVPFVGSEARTTTLMLTVSPFLTSGGSETFSTSTSLS